MSRTISVRFEFVALESESPRCGDSRSTRAIKRSSPRICRIISVIIQTASCNSRPTSRRKGARIPTLSEWQFLVTLNSRLRPLTKPVEIQELAVRLLGAHLHARVTCAYAEGDEFVIRRSCPDGVVPCGDRDPVVRCGLAIVDACRRGETLAVNDVRTDPRLTDAARDLFLAQDTAAVVTAPLLKDKRWVGTFGVHSATPRTWTPDQISLIEVLAEQTWAAEERSNAEEALARTADRQAFLRRLSDTVGPLAAPARILQDTCRLLGEHLRVNRVAYGEIDGNDCVIVNDYVNGLPSLAGRIRWAGLGGSRAADILKGATLSVNDTSTEPHTPEERVALINPAHSDASTIKAKVVRRFEYNRLFRSGDTRP